MISLLEAYKDEEQHKKFDDIVIRNNYLRFLPPDLIPYKKCLKHLKEDFAFVTIQVSQLNLIRRKRDVSAGLADKTGTVGKIFLSFDSHTISHLACILSFLLRRNNWIIHWHESPQRDRAILLAVKYSFNVCSRDVSQGSWQELRRRLRL